MSKELTHLDVQGRARMPQVIASFIGGLGGRDVSADEFAAIAASAAADGERNESSPPRLLYTNEELLEMRKLQAVAHVERSAEVTGP